MTLNGVITFILHWGQLRRCGPQKCSTKNLVFGNIRFMAEFKEITEKECVEQRRSHSIVKNRIVEHCAVMSAITELLYFLLSNNVTWDFVTYL